MIFSKTAIKDAYILDLDKKEDQRGFFARAWCQKEFKAQGLYPDWVQANIAKSVKRGTLRGLHYQKAPHQEAKLVRCTSGSIFDVLLDLRPDSHSYLQWLGVELSAATHKMLYIPEGCAHGYQSLLPDSEIFYMVSQPYSPGYERGLRWDDPKMDIKWPISPPNVISEKDANWPNFRE